MMMSVLLVCQCWSLVWFSEMLCSIIYDAVQCCVAYVRGLQKPRKNQPVKNIEEKYQGIGPIGPNEEGARAKQSHTRHSKKTFESFSLLVLGLYPR